MKQKISHRAFLGVFLGVLTLGISFLISIPGVSASLIYNQNFDSLSTGDLNGQDEWDNASGLFDVVNSKSYSNPNSIRGQSWTDIANREIQEISDGYLSYWVWVDGGATFSSNFVAWNPVSVGYSLASQIGHSAGDYFVLNLQNSIGGFTTKITDIPANVWIKVQMEWESSGHTYRIRYSEDGVNWSSWSSTEGWFADGGTNIPLKLSLRNNTDVYYDNFIVGTGSAPDADETPAPAEIKTLDFLEPLDEASTPDFSQWLLSYVYYTGTTTPESVLFNVGATTESGTTIGTNFIIESVVPDSTSTKYVFIPKNFTLPGNKWYYANGSMGNVFPGDIFATSTSHFIVSTTSSAIWQIPPESTSTELTITCDPESPFFERSLCKLANALLIPNVDDFNSLLDTWDDIKNKIPIGYFTISINSLQTLTTSTTASVSFSSLGEFTDYIKDFFTAGFWIIFVFWCFNRIKNLDI